MLTRVLTPEVKLRSGIPNDSVDHALRPDVLTGTAKSKNALTSYAYALTYQMRTSSEMMFNGNDSADVLRTSHAGETLIAAESWSEPASHDAGQPKASAPIPG